MNMTKKGTDKNPKRMPPICFRPSPGFDKEAREVMRRYGTTMSWIVKECIRREWLNLRLDMGKR